MQVAGSGYFRREFLGASTFFVLACLGCGPRGVVEPAPAVLRGSMRGGQQPISGVSVQLYAVGTSGDGSNATPLISRSVVSNANGNFDITGLFTCPAPQSNVYLVGTGGNPGLAGTVNNSAIALMATLGPCGNISSSTFISVNEVTTVASIFALASYTSAWSSPAYSSIGSSSYDQQGLASAFSLASEFANMGSGSSPGSGVPAGTVVPTETINSLADSIAPCINSMGGSAGDSTPCGQLFSLTTPTNGADSAPSPTDTITALARIAQNASLNTQSIFYLASPASPYEPTLSSAPSSFAIALSGKAFSAGPATLNLGNLAIGQTSSTYTVAVQNTGTVNLTFGTPTLSGSAAADFAATSQCQTVTPGSYCFLSLSLTPSSTGTRSATLSITESTLVAQQTVLLSGTGVAPSGTLLPGASVQLPFTEGTGTVAYDQTGNHNDCTFASGDSAPIWTTAGINHLVGASGSQRYCSFGPSGTTTDNTETNSRTKTWCGYLRPPSAGIETPNYSALIGSSQQSGLGGFWMTAGGNFEAAYYGTSRANNSDMTTTSQSIVGWHCITEELGSTTDSSADRLFYDGIEVTSYNFQGQSWDYRMVGEYGTVGYTPWQPLAYFIGTTSYIVEYPFLLTPAQITSNFQVLQFLAFYNRGVNPNSPPQSTATGNQLICNGDSLTNETPGPATNYCNELTGLNQSFYVTNIAHAGSVLGTLVSNAPLADSLLFTPFASELVISQEGGINDLMLALQTPAYAYNERVLWTHAVQQTGYRHVLWLTLISNQYQDANRAALNVMLRANAASLGVTLVDVAEDPCLGMIGAWNNPSPCGGAFLSDGIHLLQPGQDLMRNYYVNIVNYLTGSTSASPTVVSASSYQMQPADAFTVVETSNASSALTLPSCLGYSPTTPFSVANQSSGTAVNVSASAGQYLNGGSSAVSIPFGHATTFTANALPASTAR
jgi:hypothetical protein